MCVAVVVVVVVFVLAEAAPVTSVGIGTYEGRRDAPDAVCRLDEYDDMAAVFAVVAVVPNGEVAVVVVAVLVVFVAVLTL